MEQLKKRLIDQAKLHNICADGLRKISGAKDKPELVEYYNGILDWSLEHGFPDLPTIKAEFSGFENYGIFVGRTFKGEMLNDLPSYVFHDCKGTIKVSLNVYKSIIPMIYIANGCRMRIIGTGNLVLPTPSIVPIYMYGQNDLSARDNKYVKFNLFKSEVE